MKKINAYNGQIEICGLSYDRGVSINELVSDIKYILRYEGNKLDLVHYEDHNDLNLEYKEVTIHGISFPAKDSNELSLRIHHALALLNKVDDIPLEGKIVYIPNDVHYPQKVKSLWDFKWNYTSMLYMEFDNIKTVDAGKDYIVEHKYGEGAGAGNETILIPYEEYAKSVMVVSDSDDELKYKNIEVSLKHQYVV